MLKVQGVTKSYGTEIVLNKISFVISQGERVGLVGRNGAGKSTLLRIISGIEKPDGGEVVLQKGASLIYMPQSGAETKTISSFDRTNQKSGMKRLLTDLRLDHLADNDLAFWSGGELSKLRLAKTLSELTDFYLLDEPTNNLDFPALRFLEEAILENSKSSFLIVSHDREFLDRIVDKIIEIDEFSHSVKEYVGNYSHYEVEKERAREIEYRLWEANQKELKRLEESLEEKKKWVKKATKGPKVRDNNKLGRGYAKDWSKVLGGATKSIEMKIKRLEVVKKPKVHWDLRFEISPLERSGDIVLRVTNIEKRLGNFQLGPLSFELQSKERVTILGLNGAGKTTLLNLLAGNIIPDAGEIKLGSKVNIGFLEQIPQNINEVILNRFMRLTGLSETEVRKLLHKFGLNDNDVRKSVEVLSPGERMRLELAGFVAKGVNFLILDEPTNNLDLEAISELEKVISEFKGTLLVVTHDRRFLKDIGITKFYDLEKGVLRVHLFLEDYEKSFNL